MSDEFDADYIDEVAGIGKKSAGRTQGPRTAEEWERHTYGRLANVFNHPTLIHDHQLAAAIQLMALPVPMKETAMILLADCARREGGGSPEAWINLGSLLAQMDATWFKACREACGRALELYEGLDRREPDPAKYHTRERAVCFHNMSVCHMKAGALQLAQTYSRWAIALWPKRAVMWFQLGSVLARMDAAWGTPENGGYYRQALAAYHECYRMAKEGGPDSVDRESVRISVQDRKDRKDWKDGETRPKPYSIEWGDQDAATRTGMMVLAQSMIDGLHLIHGQISEFPNFRRWLNYPVNDYTVACNRNSGRLTDPGLVSMERLTGPVGIYMEQGLGDQIQALPKLVQFIRTVVKARNSTDGRMWSDGKVFGQWLIKIVCPVANAKLIHTVISHATLASAVAIQSPAEAMDQFDSDRLWIGHMDIPALLNRPDWPDQDIDLSVTTPLSDLTFELEKALDLDESGCPVRRYDGVANVGLCWHGSPAHPGDWARSVRDDLVAGIVTKLSPHLGCDPPMRLFSVQRAYYPGQIRMPLGVQDLTPHIGSTHDLAVFLTGMDAVVTVDTVVAHLCRLLGIPVWIVLPYCPDARWGMPPWHGQLDLNNLPDCVDGPTERCPVWSTQPDPTTRIYWQNPPNPTFAAPVQCDFSPFPSGPEATEPDYQSYSMAVAFQAAYRAAQAHVRGLLDYTIREADGDRDNPDSPDTPRSAEALRRSIMDAD